MRTHRFLRRAAAAAAGALALVLVGALPASAHVEVTSSDAAPGGFGLLVFQVPNESDSATTTKVEVQLPTDTPLASVSTTPTPGWTIDSVPTGLATVFFGLGAITYAKHPEGILEHNKRASLARVQRWIDKYKARRGPDVDESPPGVAAPVGAPVGVPR